MRDKTKVNEKGITLIALIITIIILVLLAAVSIKVVYESRIVNYAINGATDYTEESVKENEIIDSTESLLESTISRISDLMGKLTEEQLTNSIGAYVDYSPSTTSSFTAKATYTGHDSDQTLNTDDLQWRILSVEDGKLILISATPTNEELTLQGALGYNNAVKLLNEACYTMYSNGSYATARSLNIEDIDKAVNYTNISTSEGINYDNAYYPYIFTQEQAGLDRSVQSQYVETAYSTGDITVQVTAYIYNIAGNLTYEGLFGSSNNYWLASRCVSRDSSTAYFNVYYMNGTNLRYSAMYGTTGFPDSGAYGLRPVVEIDLSEVTIVANGDDAGSAENPYKI